MRHVNTLILALCLGLAVTACGRKEPPRIVNTGEPPQLTSFTHRVSGNVLNLSFTLQGGKGGLGYQVDRAEIDPTCNCPSEWRRYLDQPALARQTGVNMSRNINLRTHKHIYLFRIRAVDAMGNLGEWSRPIRARAEDMME